MLFRSGGMVWTGTTLITGSSRSTVWEVNFGTFGGGFLLGIGFLEPRRLGRSLRFIELEMVFLFPVWEGGFWVTGVVSSWTWMSSSPLVTAFSLFSFIVAIPMTKKTNSGFNKKNKKKIMKKKRGVDDTYFVEWSLRAQDSLQ